ncbi:hypothetical protein Ahy_A07g033829 [Arachis hypogaea]|uniref:Ubiquitin-like protease family profile domain-containing protein n=1 Tax=Arachis hypogaea TaxID=3818 RepID=A0A445CA77_ARAHY|nr:hypothetical protein Ahy_A07g033829 [Arachis hypogaea]
MCLILNQENIKRFQEEIYYLPPNIVVRCNVLKFGCILLSFGCIKRFFFCVSQMLQNMAIGNHLGGEFLQPKSKKLFKVEDYPMFILFLDWTKLASHPYGYVISRIRVYAGGTSQDKRFYDCAVYVMKWLEIIQPQNAEVDHFRIEFASQILFQEMNRDRDTAIRGSEAMRLSKPSAALLSPYYQVDSYDINSDSD